MKPRTDLSTEHRLARFAAWTMAVLAWLLAGAHARTQHRARLQHVAVAQLHRFVRRLVIIRAAQLLPMRAPMRQQRNFAPAGFRRRTRVRFNERRIAGSWLRRRLRLRGGFAEQLTQLLSVVRQWRALGAELARRRRKRLTRLYSIVPTRPPAVVCPSASAPRPAFSDSS